MGIKIDQYAYIRLNVSEKESEAVKLAAVNLRRDLIRVLDCRVNAAACVQEIPITVGTAGVSDAIEQKAELSLLKDEKGGYRKEAFLIQEKDGELLIAGTDRRGTIYGIYDFCEWLGVSPWYFFADVPVRRRASAEIPDGYRKTDYPSVEYRGIFINDEEELENWVQRYMGEETIGVKTYEKIFELLLRLKLNYIWPAMHVNSFNLKRENGALADRMGIVVGTSHCDMLMRSNNREWKPWLKRKGYTDVCYDYSIPGRNREILEEYWRESIEQNREFEVSYTLGMRGIHDSGFETRSLEGKSGKELLQAKIDLLDSVITAQERMLKETLGRETLKTFVPYKEVLELYDNGLQVPEDLTLIWVNDNYGYVRRYPGEKEKQRKSGNGIYYHNSYWAPPGGSYLFINSIPLAHTRNELKKAYEEGIRKLWVTNFGAVKPLEQQMTFYARLAWEAGRPDAVTDHEEAFLEQWIDRTFSGAHGRVLAPLLISFDQLTNTRKIEQMDCDAFSQTAYGDEAAVRIHRYEEIFAAANGIYEQLPSEEKDAFFQLVLMKIHAAYFTNAMYYYADRSNLCIRQGKNRAARTYTEKSKAFDRARQRMIYYYNHVMSNGKWNGILTPEDFPPPRTAMYPACMPPLAVGGRKMAVTVWNEGDALHFVQAGTKKWIEIANEGEGSIPYAVTGPGWLTMEHAAGTAEDECRILIGPSEDIPVIPDDEVDRAMQEDGPLLQDVIRVTNLADGDTIEIPVTCRPRLFAAEGFGRALAAVEDDGMISAEAACMVSEEPDNPDGGFGRDMCGNASYGGWIRIPNLGRDRGPLLEARRQGAVISCRIACRSEGSFLLEVHRFPSLNSVGRIRVGVSVDRGEVRVLETESNDEHRGTWSENVRNNVDKITMELPPMKPGIHTIRFSAIDKYFAFSRFVIYTSQRKENSLGITGGDQHLPQAIDIEKFADQWYGTAKLPLRPVMYLPPAPVGDSLTMEDIFRRQERLGEPIKPNRLVEQGNSLFEEKDGAVCIDAGAALAMSRFAYTQNGPWQYCLSLSHGETGLAMYIRDAHRIWKDMDDAPTLHYRFRVKGGEYHIWLLLQMWGTNTSHFALGLDGERIPEKRLYGGRPIWRYSMEQVWKWVPAWTAKLAEGEHVLSVYCLSPHLRFDRIYLTAGEELPPPDADWLV